MVTRARSDDSYPMLRRPAHPQLRAIGARIKQVRDAAGWTQEQLAVEIDVTAHTISQYECGAQSPRLSTLLRMASVLAVRPGDLIDVDLPLPTGAAPPEAAELLGFYASLGEDDRTLATRLVREVASARRPR